MKLVEAIEAYITLKRSLGAVFSADARILRSFARALGDIAVHEHFRTPTTSCRRAGGVYKWRRRLTRAPLHQRAPTSQRPYGVCWRVCGWVLGVDGVSAPVPRPTVGTGS